MTNITRWVCDSASAPLAEQKSQLDHLQPSEVLVQIKYCSLARGDVHMLDNDWHETQFPITPGHEMIGIVEQAGTQVTTLHQGDIVGVGYQLTACLTCAYCRQGFEQFCDSQEVAVLNRPGGWASHIIANEQFVQKIGEPLNKPEYATLFSSGLTVFSGITRAQLAPNSKVAVFGIGGLGHIAAMLLSKMGHEVTLLSHTPDKKKFIQQLGAHHFIDTSNTLAMQEEALKYDFIISTVNVEFDIEQLLHLLKPRGTICLVGLPQAKVSLHAATLADYAQRTIYGSYIGSVKDMRDLLDFVQTNGIKPITQQFPMSRVNELIEEVRGGMPRFRYVLTRK